MQTYKQTKNRINVRKLNKYGHSKLIKLDFQLLQRKDKSQNKYNFNSSGLHVMNLIFYGVTQIGCPLALMFTKRPFLSKCLIKIFLQILIF